MSISENTSIDPNSVTAFADPVAIEELKIRGFDRGMSVAFKEPSFYLAVSVIFVATLVSFSKTPWLFIGSFVGITAAAAGLFLLAERSVFKAKEGFDRFAVPFDGVFVLAFGAILPGLSLVAYTAYALLKFSASDIWSEIAKIALLLVVPFFNFTVWSSVRKGYLLRPRLTGLMNGLALGLSASWSVILFWTLGRSDNAIKFGWMLLLCSSPFMFAAALCLATDLWRKTEPGIKRITSNFSMLGGLLSLLFVFMPMSRALHVQSLITTAKQDSGAERKAAISSLRNEASDDELRPAQYPLSGFALANRLIADRGLNLHWKSDEDLYFEITGKDAAQPSTTPSLVDPPAVGFPLDGLSLNKSQISGTIDSKTLSSSVDWTLTFRNLTDSEAEACGDVQLPKGAVVSRATLWINGESQDGAFASTVKVTDAYHAFADKHRDPLLVTQIAPDKVRIMCSPVPAGGGEMRIRLGFKLPLQTKDGVSYSVELPKFLASDFGQTKRSRINFTADEPLTSTITGATVKQTGQGYTLSGVLRTSENDGDFGRIAVKPSMLEREAVVQDWTASGSRFIIQRLREITVQSPKHIAVVIDSSASLKKHVSEISSALSELPNGTSVFFRPEGTPNSGSQGLSVKQAQAALADSQFIGGQNNFPELREALENTAEQSLGAVVWIHGPQPLFNNASQWSALDLVNRISLYDIPIEPGNSSTSGASSASDESGSRSESVAAQIPETNELSVIPCASNSHKSVDVVVKKLVSDWHTTVKRLHIERTATATNPHLALISDKATSARLTCLWARDEVARLLATGRQKEALELATKYRIVSPVSGVVILESKQAYKSRYLSTGAYKDAPTNDPVPNIGSSVESPKSSFGLVGAAVDPRYGQSNEVGQMADFGYDTARDISRIATLLSLIISIALAVASLRSKKTITGTMASKAVGLVIAVPLIVHLLGTYIINNFGGLGGGL